MLKLVKACKCFVQDWSSINLGKTLHTFLVFLTEKKVNFEHELPQQSLLSSILINYVVGFENRKVFTKLCLYKSSGPELNLEKADPWYFQFNRQRIYKNSTPSLILSLNQRWDIYLTGCFWLVSRELESNCLMKYCRHF